jgi:hypothetical protein
MQLWRVRLHSTLFGKVGDIKGRSEEKRSKYYRLDFSKMILLAFMKASELDIIDGPEESC